MEKITTDIKDKSGIYILKFKDIIYVGSSINLYRRLNDHFNHLKRNCHRNKHLQNCYNKYTDSMFDWEIIEFCEISLLKEKEDFYIEKFDSFNKGFNQSKNSISCLGYKHTEEAKKIMSLKKKGTIQSKETIEKRKQSLIGKKRTIEQKEKCRNSKLGDKNPMFGKKLSDVAKKLKGKNMNSVPRWNKGLTKDTDDRIKKLATWKGKLPPNAMYHKLTDMENGNILESDSLSGLSKLCSISTTTLSRLKKGTAGKKK